MKTLEQMKEIVLDEAFELAIDIDYCGAYIDYGRMDVIYEVDSRELSAELDNTLKERLRKHYRGEKL